MKRRCVSLAALSVVGFPGCVGGIGNASLDQLVFDVEVVAGASDDHPTRIHAELRTDGWGTVTFGTGPTVVPIHEAGRVETVLLYPDTYVGPNEVPEEPTDDCWRYRGDDLLVQSDRRFHDLRTGDAFEETYTLYTVGEETECLPAGSYRFTDEIVDEDEEESRELHVDVTVGDGGTVTASGTIVSR